MADLGNSHIRVIMYKDFSFGFVRYNLIGMMYRAVCRLRLKKAPLTEIKVFAWRTGRKQNRTETDHSGETKGKE